VRSEASLAGEYYQSCDVNSRNCTEQSAGTSAWIAQCRRLLDRCVANASEVNPTEVREAMDIVFGLLSHIDECATISFSLRTRAVRVGVIGRRKTPCPGDTTIITKFETRPTCLLGAPQLQYGPLWGYQTLVGL
jgi:hypothetical protein